MIFTNLSLADVSAWVDKNPVVVGEMFNFHIEAKNVDETEEPDLSGIGSLQVINRSMQNQTSIVGTSITRTVKWTYVMLAPSSG
ncbi:MAG: BatD family protein, partial [SAR324 cluster bacterium]|nr:BatD family protein [SAR324 cluster bacterium]